MTAPMDRAIVESAAKNVHQSFAMMKAVMSDVFNSVEVPPDKSGIVDVACESVERALEQLLKNVAQRKPVVPIEESVKSDHLISLLDGSKVVLLKRYLKSHGLTFSEYKALFNLPDDYPLVPPSYSVMRRRKAQADRPWEKGAKARREASDVSGQAASPRPGPGRD